MAIEDTLKSLKDFDFGDLDFENVGSWPTPVKVCLLYTSPSPRD